MKYIVFLSLIVLLACTPKIQNESSESTSSSKVYNGNTEGISGIWQITSNTPRGKKSSELTITQTGNTAKVENDRGNFIMNIDGDRVSWTQNVKTPRGNVETISRGIILNDNRMEGTTELVSGMGKGRTMTWVAERK